MHETTVLLEPTKRRERVRILNDAIPGVILLFSGLSALSSRGLTRDLLPYIDVVVGALVVRFAMTELKGRDGSKRMSWFDILGGVVILFDAANQYKPWKQFQPAYLLFLAGLITIGRAVFAQKLPARRYIVIDDNGIYARTAAFRRSRLRWTEILRVEGHASRLVFHLADRTVTLNLGRYENSVEAVTAILDEARDRKVETSTQA